MGRDIEDSDFIQEQLIKKHSILLCILQKVKAFKPQYFTEIGNNYQNNATISH